MRFSALRLAPLLLAPLFSHCGSGSAPTANAVTGPFDSRGNYIEDWVDQPDKWFKPSSNGESTKSNPKELVAKNETPPPEVLPEITPLETRTVSEPRPEVTRPKPRPEVVKAKPKPKPKPTIVRYTVKRGDSLSKIASSRGVSLSALRRANKISGDIIRPGQVLTIPR